MKHAPSARLALELQDYAVLPMTADNTNTNTRARGADIRLDRRREARLRRQLRRLSGQPGTGGRSRRA